MARTIGIGIQSFSKLRTGNLFYVDKTSFVKEWWETEDEVTLITRPRRFGKTLNLSMLEHFFSIDYAGRSDLFEGLVIWEEEKYRKLQGTYPVISLSFAGIKETTYQTTRKKICEMLTTLYEKHLYLLDSDVLSEKDKAYFKRVSETMDDSDASMALHHLSDYLYRYYGKKVIILLDEYDTPMQESYVGGYWEELVFFTRSLFHCAFKTNPHLERALMTGITRVSKKSIFSDLNHLKIITTTSTEYATSFGFTEKEVFKALEEYGFTGEKEEIKRWYDGFVFGEIADIYNPWSILNYLDTGRIDTYWVNTSGNRLVSKLVRESGRKLKDSFIHLLKGERIQCPIDEQIVYNQLYQNDTAIWSLLLTSGYLKVLSYERLECIGVEKNPMYEVELTNYEVRRMFFGLVKEWFSSVEDDYGDFIRAFLKNDLKEMNAYMNLISRDVFSYFDTGKKKSILEPERFYHGFVLGLLVELHDRYIVTSNRESGFGRYDVMLEPKNKKEPAMIIEFKIHESDEEKDLKETVAAAKRQIEEKEYAAVLLARGIPEENIRMYGFAFQGKKVMIG